MSARQTFPLAFLPCLSSLSVSDLVLICSIHSQCSSKRFHNWFPTPSSCTGKMSQSWACVYGPLDDGVSSLHGLPINISFGNNSTVGWSPPNRNGVGTMPARQEVAYWSLWSHTVPTSFTRVTHSQPLDQWQKCCLTISYDWHLMERIGS